jgi:hypothetical protein
MKKLAYIVPLAALVIPAVAFAQVAGNFNGSYIVGIIDFLRTTLNALIPILIALALVAFFWGLVRYVWSGGEAKESGYKMMISSLIALFVMVSVWGIIKLAQSVLGVQGNATVTAPKTPQ